MESKLLPGIIIVFCLIVLIYSIIMTSVLHKASKGSYPDASSSKGYTYVSVFILVLAILVGGFAAYKLMSTGSSAKFEHKTKVDGTVIVSMDAKGKPQTVVHADAAENTSSAHKVTHILENSPPGQDDPHHPARFGHSNGHLSNTISNLTALTSVDNQNIVHAAVAKHLSK